MLISNQNPWILFKLPLQLQHDSVSHKAKETIYETVVGQIEALFQAAAVGQRFLWFQSMWSHCPRRTYEWQASFPGSLFASYKPHKNLQHLLHRPQSLLLLKTALGAI